MHKEKLQYKNTKVLEFFGLSSRRLSEEIAKLNGPSYKTCLRLINGESNSIRPQTLKLLKRASNTLYGQVLPSALGCMPSADGSDMDDNISEEQYVIFSKYAEWLDIASEVPLCDLIANNCGELASKAMNECEDSRQFLYNLCLWHGAEYAFFYPHDTDMLVIYAPEMSNGEIALPLRKWAKDQLVWSEVVTPKSPIMDFTQLATELGITKQALHRYMEADCVEHLPRYNTLLDWMDAIKEVYGDKSVELMLSALCVSRLLHHFYLDTVKTTSLSEMHVLELFALSKELRALWPPILQRWLFGFIGGSLCPLLKATLICE